MENPLSCLAIVHWSRKYLDLRSDCTPNDGKCIVQVQYFLLHEYTAVHQQGFDSPLNTGWFRDRSKLVLTTWRIALWPLWCNTEDASLAKTMSSACVYAHYNPRLCWFDYFYCRTFTIWHTHTNQAFVIIKRSRFCSHYHSWSYKSSVLFANRNIIV